MKLADKKIIGIDVYADGRKSRTYIGRLQKNKEFYHFRYDKKYLYSKNNIPLGPELPLTKEDFYSKKLFIGFLDRIPSKQNPAYPEYCKKFGINADEKNFLYCWLQ